MSNNDVRSCCYPARNEAIPEVTGFIETTASRHGFTPQASMKLQLAVEEIVQYIAGTAPGQMLTFMLQTWANHMTLLVELAADAVDLRIFNLTWKTDLESQASLNAMGLNLAARYADRFALSQTENGMLRFQFGVDREIPDMASVTTPPAPFSHWRLTRPRAQHMPMCHALAARCLGRFKNLPSLIHVGRLHNLCLHDELNGAVAVSDQDQVVGCALSARGQDGLTSFFGPFVSLSCSTEERQRMAVSLTEYALEQTARKNIPGMYCLFNDPDCFPAHYFTRIGKMALLCRDGSREHVPAHYFPLRDDPGADLYFHPLVQDFLQARIREQYLSRQMIDASPLHQEICSKHPHTVLGVDMDPKSLTVRMHLLMYGADVVTILDDHLRLFAQKGMRTLLFTTDLSRPSHALILPHLLERGFETAVFVPLGNQGGDQLVLQCCRDENGEGEPS
ncbi:ATP-binding protein [Desulfoplanes formicivorans]|uniref:Uncharacterized protein n=1 Tax=Desulfoplanes formicivorans TaxID=1592317 RepID=A0A194AHZ9_9BACT|nr:hypothetical protein [Desulfoplanes formicivorans]GAU08953.1 hypothetical protein DPF_1672 [Desulfoplanes formicivorans]